jgi:hypothetical protein
MNRHPSDEELLLYCESAERPAAEQIRRHLETECDRCSERIATMREILAGFHVPPLAPAPEAYVRLALEKIAELQRKEARATGGDGVIEKVRRILEETRLGLALDTAVGAAMQGIRGSATSELRQLLFESPHGTLLLQVEAGPGAFSFIGQLAPSGPAEGMESGVVLIEGEAESFRGRLSKEGEFRVGGVPAGTVRVRIEWGDRALVTDPIDLGAGLNG